VELKVLGGFGVVVDGRPVADDAWPKRSGADLVKLLALADGRRMPRDAALEALWPHLDADAAARSLYKAATYARQALGDRRALVIAEGFVELAPGAEVESDLARFEAGEAGAYGGELLPDDRYAGWAGAARERVRARRVDLLRRDRRWSELVKEDPGDEPAHRELMRTCGARGDRAGVAQQFRRLRSALAEAGVHPSDETLELYRELARGPAVRAPLQPRAALAGREAELARGDAMLREVLAGSGRAVLVVGVEGAGKTRFAEEVLARAAALGMHTLYAAGGTEKGRTAYGPVRGALEPLIEERPDLVARLSESARQAIEQVLAGVETPTSPHAGIDRHRTFSAVGRLLAEAAAEHGALVVLDDLDTADEASVTLFQYLARGLAAHRLALLGTVREPVAGPVEQTITLARLDREATATLAEQTAGRTLPPETVDAIDRAAAGNALFIVELAGTVDAAGEIAVPATLEEAMRHHIDRLETVVGDLLPWLAVLEDGFTAEEVAGLAEADLANAATALDEAVDAGLLERFLGGYRLDHAIVRQALAGRLPATRLEAAHADAAQRLSRDGAPPERIAYHLIGAGRGGEAVPLLESAARWAAGIGAYRDGLEWASQALDHADAAQRPALLALLADLRLGAGDARAAAAYEAAIATAPGDEVPGLCVRLARARLAAGDVEGAAAALERCEPEALEDRGDLVVWRGIVAWHRNDLEEARRAAVEAESLGAEAVRAAELGALLAHADGRFEHHAQLELSAVWREPELAGRVFDAYLCVTERVLESGEPYPRIASFAKRVRAEARRAGARRGEAFAATVLGETELLTGDVSRARDSLAEAARLSRQAGARGAEAVARLRLGQALLHLGDRAAASSQLDEALELAQVPSLASHLVSLVYGVLVRVPPDPLEAVSVAERGEQLFDPRWLCPTCPLEYWLASATACSQAGEPDAAERFVRHLRQANDVWPHGPVRAAVAEAEAHLSLARGATDEARERFRLALEGYALAGQRLREQRVLATIAAL
jgi:DNA-binding SARP family transcriptional activator/tetratricopeptide (TPR) repeat protein